MQYEKFVTCVHLHVADKLSCPALLALQLPLSRQLPNEQVIIRVLISL